jgi:hypothetical protein
VPTFSTQFLFLSDRLQQLKDALASETISVEGRKHVERQLLIVERALKGALEEEKERRRREQSPANT